MHPDDDTIQRLAHDELSPEERGAVEAHLSACTECRDRLEGVRREEEEVHALLAALDHPLPDLDAATVAARADGDDGAGATGSAVARSGRGPSSSGPRAPRWGRWAAGILLGLFAAGAAYAAPGSPLPGWLDRVAQGLGVGSGTETRPPGAPEAEGPAGAEVEGAPETPAAGISVAPGDSLVVLFAEPQSAGEVRITLADTPEVAVRALDPGVTFTSEPSRIVVGNPGSSGDFEVRIPADARRVEIRLDGRALFLKTGERVTTEAVPDSSGVYRLSLTGPGR